jgi:hypothetical protein
MLQRTLDADAELSVAKSRPWEQPISLHDPCELLGFFVEGYRGDIGMLLVNETWDEARRSSDFIEVRIRRSSKKDAALVHWAHVLRFSSQDPGTMLRCQYLSDSAPRVYCEVTELTTVNGMRLPRAGVFGTEYGDGRKGRIRATAEIRDVRFDYVVIDRSIVTRYENDPNVTYVNRIDGKSRLSLRAIAEREAAAKKRVEDAQAELKRASNTDGLVSEPVSARPIDRTSAWTWGLVGGGATLAIAAALWSRRTG